MTKRDLILHMQAHHRDVLAVKDSNIERLLRTYDRGTLEQFHEQSRQHRLYAGLPEHDSVKDDRPRCTCGAREYRGCFCNLTIRDFLASGDDRRI